MSLIKQLEAMYSHIYKIRSRHVALFIVFTAIIGVQVFAYDTTYAQPPSVDQGTDWIDSLHIRQHFWFFISSATAGTILVILAAALLLINLKVNSANILLKKQLASQQKESDPHRELSQILAQSNLGICSCDMQGNILSVNEAFAHLHGYNAADLTDTHISIFDIPEQVNEIDDAIKKLLETGTFEGRTIHLRQDGSTFPAFMTNALFHDESGKIRGMITTLRDISDLVEVEQKLKNSEKCHRLIFENISDVIFVAATNGDVTFVSPNVQTIFGKTHQEITSQGNISQLLGRAFAEQLKAEDYEELTDVEVVVQDITGQERHLLITVKPVRILNGSRLITCREITKRKSLENELTESQMLLDSFFSESPAGLIIHDDQLRYIRVNQNVADQNGLPQDEHPGKKLEEVVGEFSTFLRPLLQKVIDTGEPILNVEISGAIPGQEEPGYWVFSAFRITRNTQKCVGVVVVNITEQKRAAVSLEKRNHELATLFSIIEMASCSLNLDDMFSLLMDKLVKTFDMEIAGIYIVDSADQSVKLAAHRGISDAMYEASKILAPGEGLSGHAIMNKRVVTGTPNSFDLNNVALARKVKQEKMEVFASIPLLSKNEAFGAINLASRRKKEICENDINLMKTVGYHVGAVIENAMLVEKVKNYSKELEKEVLERTSELEKAHQALSQSIVRLKEAKEEAESKAAELESFSYSVSHDLKSPLRGIEGYSRLLLEDYSDQLDGDGVHFLEMMCRSTRQMDMLINDLLKYSRVNSKETILQEVNIKQLITEIVRSRFHDLETDGIELNLDLNLHQVMSEPEGLAHALSNLLDNAIKFSSQRTSPKVSITGFTTDRDVIIEVSDNGIGFDMAYQDKIFGMFHRLERSEDYAGTGVGLAIVKKVMDRLGGRVWVEAEKGIGATFSLAIPVNLEDNKRTS